MRLPLSLCLVFLASASAAQHTVPSEWHWVLDRSAQLVETAAVPDSAWRFVEMPPGWHVTTGPGAFLHAPRLRARAPFVLASTAYLFPNPSNEGFGLFIGDDDRDPELPSGTAFLLRRDGAATIVRADGPMFEPVVPWTVVAGARPHTGGVVENHLAIDVGADSVAFMVNADTLAVLPRDEIPVEGRFGFRIGSGLNLHISTLDLTSRLAPPRKP